RRDYLKADSITRVDEAPGGGGRGERGAGPPAELILRKAAPKPHAQDWMRPLRRRDDAVARVLDRERPFLGRRADLHDEAHRRARPAIDQRAVLAGLRLAEQDLLPLPPRRLA